MNNNYDTVTSDWAEMYEEYCAESDRLFFEWQDQMRYEHKERVSQQIDEISKLWNHGLIDPKGGN